MEESHYIGKAWHQLISKPPQMSQLSMSLLPILLMTTLLKITSQMDSRACLGVTRWQLHDLSTWFPDPQCLSRCSAAVEEGGDVVMLLLLLQTWHRVNSELSQLVDTEVMLLTLKQWKLLCSDLKEVTQDYYRVNSRYHRVNSRFWVNPRYHRVSQLKMERQVPDVFNVFALGEPPPNSKQKINALDEPPPNSKQMFALGNKTAPN